MKDLTITELKQRKSDMETKISQSIFNIINDFYNETGVITSAVISQTTVQSFSNGSRSIMSVKSTCSLDIEI
jgi:hypothetical protein